MKSNLSALCIVYNTSGVLTWFCDFVASQMDPWQPCPANNPTSDDISSHTSTDVVGLALRNEDTSVSEVQDQNYTTSLPNHITDFCEEDQNQPDSLTFGDNFQPFVKLSDSQQYLESLGKN